MPVDRMTARRLEGMTVYRNDGGAKSSSLPAAARASITGRG
jgi:hypothetical protein